MKEHELIPLECPQPDLLNTIPLSDEIQEMVLAALDDLEARGRWLAARLEARFGRWPLLEVAQVRLGFCDAAGRPSDWWSATHYGWTIETRLLN